MAIYYLFAITDQKRKRRSSEESSTLFFRRDAYSLKNSERELEHAAVFQMRLTLVDRWTYCCHRCTLGRYARVVCVACPADDATANLVQGDLELTDVLKNGCSCLVAATTRACLVNLLQSWTGKIRNSVIHK